MTTPSTSAAHLKQPSKWDLFQLASHIERACCTSTFPTDVKALPDQQIFREGLWRIEDEHGINLIGVKRLARGPIIAVEACLYLDEFSGWGRCNLIVSEYYEITGRYLIHALVKIGVGPYPVSTNPFVPLTSEMSGKKIDFEAVSQEGPYHMFPQRAITYAWIALAC